MTGNAATQPPAPGAPSQVRAARVARRGVSLDTGLIAALALLAVAWVGIECRAVPEKAKGPVAASTVLVAVAATIAAASRSAPAQNVWLAAGVTALLSTGILVLDAALGIPFGKMRYMDAAGPRIFGLVPWAMPLVWVAVVLNARGVARLIMRPWRKSQNYGLWVMGVAAFLAASFDLGLEVFASRLGRFWVWETRPGLPTWYGAPVSSVIGWLMGTLLILAFVTPLLINKRGTGSHHRSGVQPLAIWIVLSVMLASVAAVHGLWLGAAVIIASTVVTSALAIYGASW
ncbi:MAG: carotenoid biosynthesis protein [Verrucomicrobiae bacterium]|nr:carotenoid biosynthesis protein [Verrucomicrobiae bacterium]